MTASRASGWMDGIKRVARVAAAALLASAAPIIGGAAAPATASHWQVDAARSELTFSAVQAGARFEGRFTRFEPVIDFDPTDLKASRFVVTVDLASADTRDKERDDTLRSQDFFNVARWPQARFESSSFAASSGKFEAQGQLTLRDVTRPVKLVFTFKPSDDGRTARLSGGTTIQRLDFGVGQGEWKDTTWVGNPVDIRFDLALAKPGGAAP